MPKESSIDHPVLFQCDLDPTKRPSLPSRRSVSVETRRFAAIRLAAQSTTYQQELARMVRNAKEENQRRGGYVRIFPTPETWQNYGTLLEYSSQNNLILHEHLYPNATRKAQRLNKRGGPPPANIHRTFDLFRSVDVLDPDQHTAHGNFDAPRKPKHSMTYHPRHRTHYAWSRNPARCQHSNRRMARRRTFRKLFSAPRRMSPNKVSRRGRFYTRCGLVGMMSSYYQFSFLKEEEDGGVVLALQVPKTLRHVSISRNVESKKNKKNKIMDLVLG